MSYAIEPLTPGRAEERVPESQCLLAKEST